MNYIALETKNFIAQAVKDGIIQESHLKDLQNGTMTTDRLNRENEDQQSLFSRAGLFFVLVWMELSM
ncbi:hypothetical protein [Lysinibacillus pakistanensis]|uniref:Uncharacterized protein n=1 Tax=Lysinibacillus pakistanensis TaxID=759811 RepID=A0AAX3WTA9_9BACI|nr:hypothetical protein [Lysinibacillus pakistanensis]MDM5229754.1 hypothetical protein [Lysinibacillus pakistanensis]WHY45359.1 hypothetical protein QNH22_18880 [Lysinibacillus pakistanensis]WHY50367.1 hypothetical protein QNH24_18845 [Lysinibacillus pakistanensis]